MKKAVFDFKEIQTLPHFYRLFQQQFGLESNLANNLDGLWDAVTGMIELPVKIEFINLTLNKLDKFEKLVSLFEDAQEELDDELEFSYFIGNEKF